MRRVVWLFTDRRGGVSGGPFRALNLSGSVGDEPDHVAINRRRTMERIGLGDGEYVSLAKQVHSSTVLYVDAGGAADLAGEAPSHGVGPGGWRVVGTGDALVTTRVGRPVGVLVADCAPVILAEREGRGVAAVHAGWRGLAAGVIQAAVMALCRAAGSSPERLRAWVGPCVRACCYEVGPEVAEAVSAAARRGGTGDGLPSYLHPGAAGRFFLDVADAARVQLEQAGVPAEACWVDGRCTFCHPELFFSYRRDGPRSGRMAGIVALMEERG